LVFYDTSKIEIGNYVYFAYGSWLSAGTGIVIDDEVQVGPYVVIASSNHIRENGSFRFGPKKGSAIHIGKGSWIGAHCILGAGTEMGPGSAIAANSFINSVIPSDVLAGGSPAKVIKHIEG